MISGSARAVVSTDTVYCEVNRDVHDGTRVGLQG
jgi:hypothetical protein